MGTFFYFSCAPPCLLLASSHTPLPLFYALPPYPFPPTFSRAYFGALQVSLEDLYNGKTAKLAVSRDKIVGTPQTCRDCNGKGVVVRLRQIGPGMVQQLQQQCPTCGASGVSVQKQKERQVLEVNIERGMKNGEKIRFRGMSDEQPNAEPGDIVFLLQEKEHAVFKRKNNDLLINKEVTLKEALCGYSFTVTHLDGRKLTVASKPGEILRPDNGPVRNHVLAE